MPDRVFGTDNPEDHADPDGLSDIDKFARFVRSTKAPSRDTELAQTPAAIKGSKLFDALGCATCHVRDMKTLPAGAFFNGGTFQVPPTLAGKVFHPFSDFLLHDVGTGDGISLAAAEHWGAAYQEMQKTYDLTANRMRTPPLWGLRMRSRLMHDGKSLTVADAIRRHKGEASLERKKFLDLSESKKKEPRAFLESL